MFRITRFRLAVVLLVVVGAFFIDGYSLIYRYFVAHQPLGQTLTSTPSFLGRDLFIHKGLDLQGGTELTIEVCHGFNNPPGSDCRAGPPNGSSPAALQAAQQATIPILDLRVNSLGVSEASVQAQGNDQILVQLPGVSLKQAVATIGTTQKLYFATAVAGAADPTSSSFIADQQGLYDPAQFSNPTLYPTGYHWKIDKNLQATDVNSATVGTSSTSGAIAVDINFNAAGATEWAKITNAAFAVYQSNPTSPNAQIAIFLDNEVLTAPQVTGGGQSNQTEITGNFTSDSATQLASLISAGALPASITTVASNTVSATLGQQSITLSLIAGAIGLLIVIVFMIGYYRFPGVLATIALFIYAAIVLALFKLIPVTLSLAGLAGFVLSVGMAVDANVLIFERTRDELRHGRSTPVAVETGFRRAFPAIRDSNISTLITCAILAFFGTNVIRGFAITLAIGVIVSFFTAITITRSLFAWVLSWRIGRNPRLYTEIHEEFVEHPPRGRFDIVKNRNWFFLGSLAVIIPGILAIIFWGFNLGIDFRGGNVVNIGLTGSVSQAQVTTVVKSVASDLRPAVQAQGTNSNGVSHFAISTLPSDTERLFQIDDALGAKFTIATDPKSHQPDVSFQQVGPTIASSLVTGAIIMIFVSAAAIAIYLAFAFRRQRAISPWRFSACAFFKLLHDVFVLAGIWAILGHFTDLGQVDSLFVTAVLTSVAFSIHDTIVVFDRVRENLRVGPRLTFDQVINLSTVQTMTRSLNTSLTVVFVLLSLVIFGGDSIRGFVLALLIGIVSGTYSSIFNASTLLVAWDKARASRSAAPPAGRRRVATRSA
ncbi:MAG TPA: protein translocase subunit SecD [Candidatus Saccharimonadales bacterium]|nr:protein translocase subunit SecD [Candidatus Saccharimonadales bacterium]